MEWNGLASTRETVVELFDQVDVLRCRPHRCCPSLSTEFPEVAGQAMPDYLGWMMSCCVITTTGAPNLNPRRVPRRSTCRPPTRRPSGRRP